MGKGAKTRHMQRYEQIIHRIILCKEEHIKKGSVGEGELQNNYPKFRHNWPHKVDLQLLQTCELDYIFVCTRN